jgi:hypothetical protein
MLSRLLAAIVAVVVSLSPGLATAQGNAHGSVTGRILDAAQGLPVPNAHVVLEAPGAKAGSGVTDPSGVFSISDVAPGEYSLLIVASGYLSTRVPSVVVIAGQTTELQTAVQYVGNESTSLKEIGRVVVSRTNALQTTTTINQYIDPANIQNYGYTRSADLLGTLPGVTAETSSSVADDVSISIRGYDPSETATMLDGHPIGPIGAFGGGFNYKVSPFWGLSGTSVIFGSGATGFYGTPTIAGGVNFQSLDPTLTPQGFIQQGVGNSGHALSGFQATGTVGKLGYAVAGAVQGTYGQFYPTDRTQTAFLSSSAVYTDNVTNPGTPYSPPDLTSANVNNPANTYLVSGNSTTRNFLAKAIYSFSPRTQLQLTANDWTQWDDKTGEGDNDYLPSQTAQYNAPVGNDFTLPSGAMTNCGSSLVAVLNDSAQGFTCMTPQQYGQAFSGPDGGGIGRWSAMHLQDYDGRLTQQLGATQVVLDTYVDNYNLDEHKGPDGAWHFNTYLTHGYLASDEFTAGKNNDVTVGYSQVHQRHDDLETLVPAGTYYLTSMSYYAQDAWTPSHAFSLFANLYFQRSVDTATTTFDPRLSLVFHPTNNDVIRVTGGHAYSEPDPSLLLEAAPSLGSPSSLNSFCGTGELNSVGSVASAGLKPETATDVEVSYGHRFNRTTTVQIDAYSSNEINPILSGTLPISDYPQFNSYLQQPYTEPNGTVTTLEQGFLDRIASQCSSTPTSAVLGWTTTANAGSGLHQGVDLSGEVQLIRNLQFAADFGLQSAQYRNIPIGILQNNTGLINGAQITSIPLQKGNLSFNYTNPSGIRASIQGNYVGANNPLNRQGSYWYADAFIAAGNGPVLVTFGGTNIFNNIAQQYGFIGLGPVYAQNQFGSNAINPNQASEMYGLPYRQLFLNVRFKL